jgi:hypothetical protein
MTPMFLRYSLGRPLTLADLWALVEVFSEPWNATERDIVVRTADGQAVALEVAFDASELHSPPASGSNDCHQNKGAARKIDPL